MSDFERGRDQGRTESDIGNLMALLKDHITKQEEWNQDMNRRATALEAWVQTTTGKVVVLTSIFSVVGTVAYFIINWLIAHFKLN